jgi:PKD repeat protein
MANDRNLFLSFVITSIFMKYLHLYLIFGILLFSLNDGFGQCNADFTVTQTNCNQSASFSIDNVTAGKTYTWDFGYATPTVTGTNVSHTFPTISGGNTNTYQVTVSESGCNSNTNTTQSVIISQVPNAAFTYTGSSCSRQVNFTKTSPSSGYTYSWDFGYGSNNNSNASPNHTFPLIYGGGTNTYNVTLMVTSSCGSVSSSQNVVIDQKVVSGLQSKLAPNIPIDNQFALCNSTASSPTDILYVNDISQTAGANNLSYNIDWGDMTPDFNGTNIPANLSHSYISQGAFVLTLTVTGNNGCSEVYTYNVYNGNNPNVGLAIGTTVSCAPGTFSFPISNTSNNPPGTIYTVTVNDGTSPAIYDNSNLPGLYTYTFDSTSCGINSINFTDAYQVEIVASNACGSSIATVEPIRIYKEPDADFEILPDTNCAGSNFVFTNTSIAGNYFLSALNSCVNFMDAEWSITPNAGYNITSGSLTNVTGFGADFNVAGIYTIKLIVKNSSDGNSCQPDTIEKQIFVSPQAEFTYNSNPCDKTVSFTPNSINPALTYTWNFGYGSVTTNTVSLTHTFPLIYGGGTNAYNVTLTVTSSCGTVSSSQNVVIDQKVVSGLQSKLAPNIPIDNQFALCNSTASSPTDILYVNDISQTAGANNLSYNIDWGDMTPDFNGTNIPANLSHSYISQGAFVLTLTVTGNNGCSEVYTYNVYNGNNPNVGLAIGTTVSCAPGTFSFPISNTSNNPPGTIYTVTVNDGTSPAIYDNSNLPGLYTYTFDSTSCGINSINFTDAYQVEIVASNACGSSIATVEPIRIYKEPDADFEILPDTNCAGSNFVFTNTSIAGNYFLSALNSCVNFMDAEWSITPNAGYNITSGSLTNVTGFGADFNVAGIYTIKLIVKNSSDGNSCQPDTIEKQICVVPLPQAGFSIASDFGCFPHTTAISNASNTLTACESSNYSWSSTFVGSDCGSGSNVQFIGGSNQNSQNVTLQFDSSGVYVVTLVDSNRCNINTFTDTITVANAPQVLIAPILDYCHTATITPQIDIAATNTCYSPGTYAWDFSGGSPSTGTGENPGNITYSASNTPYVVTLTVTNSCGINSTTESFNVFPLPTLPNLNAQGNPYCATETIKLRANNPPNNISYNWEFEDGTFIDSIRNVNIGNATTAMSGWYILTITDNTTGCQNIDSVQVNVTDLPTITIAGDTSICFGESTTLIGNGASTYEWNVGITSTNQSVTVSPNSDRIYQVIGTNGVGCIDSISVTVIVNPLPVVTATGPATTCVNAPTQLTGTGTTTAGLWSDVWEWQYIDMNGVFNSPNTGVFSSTYIYTDANGCADSAAYAICVLANPAANFTLSNTEICINNTIAATNTSNTLSGCDSETYTWAVTFNSADCHAGTGAFTFASGNANSQNASFNFTQSGIYTIFLTAANNCGSDIETKTITVVEPPQVSIDTTSIFCANATVNPTVTTNDCNGAISNYSWIFAGGSPNSSTSATPNNIMYNSSGTYTIEVNVANQCGTTNATLDFDVHTLPTPTVTQPTCSVPSGTIVVNATASTGTLEYSINNGTTYQVGNTFIGLSVGNYTIKVREQGSACEVVYGNNPVVINPVPTLSVALPTVTQPICTGPTGTIVVNATTSTGTLEYSIDNGTTYQSSDTFSGLSAGSYTIKVREQGSACEVVYGNNPVIINTPVIIVSAPIVIQPTCSTLTGIIIIIATTSTGTLEYSIDNGSTYQLNNTFIGLSVGNYTIKVREQGSSCEEIYGNNPMVINDAGACSDSCAVLWKGILKASVTGTTFTKTNTKEIWNAGAYSADTLLAGTDGYTEMEILETNTTRMFGLAEPNGNPNDISIDYGIRLNSSGAKIVESGNVQSNLGAYASGDIFKVGRVGTMISYYHNGNLVYTSSTASSTELVVDISILTFGGTIHNAYASFGCNLDCSIFAVSVDELSDETCIGANNGSVTVTSSIGGATYEWLDNSAEITTTRNNLMPGVYTVVGYLSNPMCSDTLDITIGGAALACSDSCLIAWTDLTNSVVEKNGIRLKKTTAAPGWDAGAISENYLASGISGWIQMGIKELNKLRVFGLASYNTTTAFEDIDYGFQMRSRRTFRVVENGIVKANFGTFTTTDVFRIERNGTTITYLYNGAVVYTSTVPSTGNLYADASLFKQKASIVKAYASFGCTEPVLVGLPRIGQPNNLIEAENGTAKAAFDKVTVYPNPFTEQVTIDYATDIENVNSIELYNINGQHIRTIQISENGQTIINTSDLANGLYIISINGIKHFKVVKM